MSRRLNENAGSILITLRWLLDELIKDGWITQDESNLISSTPRGKDQLQWHPLQIVANANLKSHKAAHLELSLGVLSQWLANKAEQPLYQIDPLKIDVQAVTKVMSYAFAERHQIIAVEVTDEEVIIASAQPFHHEWKVGLSQVIGDKTIARVVANPADIHRYSIEFYNLAKSVSGATGDGGQAMSGVTNFEQLLELGELTSADANDQHIVNIVDWLLQYAFDQIGRASCRERV